MLHNDLQGLQILLVGNSYGAIEPGAGWTLIS
jgi:hypothetical protein